jgi:hypothetical protein
MEGYFWRDPCRHVRPYFLLRILYRCISIRSKLNIFMALLRAHYERYFGDEFDFRPLGNKKRN